jgi:hypothetical protein
MNFRQKKARTPGVEPNGVRALFALRRDSEFQIRLDGTSVQDAGTDDND